MISLRYMAMIKVRETKELFEIQKLVQVKYSFQIMMIEESNLVNACKCFRETRNLNSLLLLLFCWMILKSIPSPPELRV